MIALANVCRVLTLRPMTPRAVRDTCLRLAEASPSRLERVALLTIAFFAERDESSERVALAPEMPPMDEETMGRFLDRCMDKYMTDLRAENTRTAS